MRRSSSEARTTDGIAGSDGFASALAASLRATTASFWARSSAIMKSCRFGAADAAISRSTSPSTTSSISAVGQRLHVEERRPRRSPRDVLGLVLADQLLDARCSSTITSTAATRPPPMRGRRRWRDDALEHAGEDRAHLRLLDRREELDQPADRLGRVDRVHRREHEVAGLGGLQRRLGRLAVAQLADQDHVGVLAQRAAERLVERLGVEPDLALVDDAALVVVEDLDRILDRDDVLPARPVDVADDRGERRRLAGAGRARDEDEPAVLLGEPLDAGRQVEALRSSARRAGSRGRRTRCRRAGGRR